MLSRLMGGISSRVWTASKAFHEHDEDLESDNE